MYRRLMNIQKLKDKLNESNPIYTNEEINWMFNHIGDPDSLIRDSLVCNSLGKGFLEEKFSLNQAHFLIEKVKTKNTLFYKIDEIGIPTLTRSFTCLFWDLIIKVNNDPESEYFKILTNSEEKELFKNLLVYLAKESDFTGFSKKYGWFHAVAHCADAVADGMKSDNFGSETVSLFLSSTYKLLNRVDRRFIDGEEYRLADAFIEGFKNQKISNEDFIDWIKSFDFNPYATNLIEFYRFNNLKSLVENIYIKLNALFLLNTDVKDYIEKHFSNED